MLPISEFPWSSEDLNSSLLNPVLLLFPLHHTGLTGFTHMFKLLFSDPDNLPREGLARLLKITNGPLDGVLTVMQLPSKSPKVKLDERLSSHLEMLLP